MGSIMTRDEMFEIITNCDDLSNLSEHELKLRQEYFEELIKPITYECKKFTDDYLRYFKQRNKLPESDKELFIDRILGIVFNELKYELNLYKSFT